MLSRDIKLYGNLRWKREFGGADVGLRKECFVVFILFSCALVIFSRRTRMVEPKWALSKITA